MRLKNKAALVTGGGTGIGLAVAAGLAAEGCRVGITGRREDVLKRAAESRPTTPPLVYHGADVGDRSSVDALFSWAEGELGGIDILVNNAGVNVPKRRMSELDPDDWDRMLRINATGAFLCMRAALPHMREQGDGLIVNIVSIAGKRASLLGGVGYCASKFAQTALGMTVALEDGKHGVRVTSIYPGEVNTPILENRPQPVDEAHKQRILQPEDLAAAVVMVACLPPRAHVAEMVIKPTSQDYA